MTATPDDLTASEHHFAINIKLAWSKLDNYYSKLDNTPVYVAAVVLHPCLKWNYFERHWQSRQDWIKAARSSFNSLLINYEYMEVDQLDYSPSKRQRRSSDVSSDDYSDNDIALSIEQQLSEYLRDRSHKDTVKNKRTSPIDYWLNKRQQQWPQLAALTLNIYSIAVVLDEPERVFSITGAAITPRRRSLNDQKIGYIMCLKAWIRSKIIQLDRCLHSHQFATLAANHVIMSLFRGLVTPPGVSEQQRDLSDTVVTTEALYPLTGSCGLAI